MTKKRSFTLKLGGRVRILLLRCIHGLPPVSQEESWARFNARADLLGEDWDWGKLRQQGQLTPEQSDSVVALQFSTETLRSLGDIIDRMATPAGLIPMPPTGMPGHLAFDDLSDLLPISRRVRAIADGKEEDDTPPAIERANGATMDHASVA